jgi:hypothetical protein
MVASLQSHRNKANIVIFVILLLPLHAKVMKLCKQCGMPIKVSKKSNAIYCRKRCKQSAYYRRKIISGLNRHTCENCKAITDNPINVFEQVIQKYNSNQQHALRKEFNFAYRCSGCGGINVKKN